MLKISNEQIASLKHNRKKQYIDKLANFLYKNLTNEFQSIEAARHIALLAQKACYSIGRKEENFIAKSAVLETLNNYDFRFLYDRHVIFLMDKCARSLSELDLANGKQDCLIRYQLIDFAI